MPFVEFAINNSFCASAGGTTFCINGLRHPRTPVSFLRSLSLSGREPLTMLGSNAEDRYRFANVIGKNCLSDPASAAVVTAQESVEPESRHTLSMLQSNDDRSS